MHRVVLITNKRMLTEILIDVVTSIWLEYDWHIEYRVILWSIVLSYERSRLSTVWDTGIGLWLGVWAPDYNPGYYYVICCALGCRLTVLFPCVGNDKAKAEQP